jgi:hypothetical protein
MVSGSRNARRRRRYHGRPGGWHGKADPKVLIPLSIPAAFGLALGIVLAVSGSPDQTITPSALESSGFGSQSAAAIPPVPPDCSLIVPLHPLTAAGLATPWQLTGPGGADPNGSGCTEANQNLDAFVQATILDPATGQLWVYEPLVVTAGTTPAAAPAVPKLPADAVTDIMIGFNGNNLQLLGAGPQTLANAHCVNGLGGSLFGQVSYCGSGPFFAAAQAAMADGRLKVPSNGISPVTGQQCPTTRSFDIVDQDPSDNVTTQYLVTGTGQTAQDTAANQAALAGSQVINNGSDNELLDVFVLPALRCAPFTAPDLSNGGAAGTSQSLDELMAAKDQQAPIALTPLTDPMTLRGAAQSTTKTNLYRQGVGQAPVSAAQTDDTPAMYCANMLNAATRFINGQRVNLISKASPSPAAGNNLFTFMAARLSMSFTNLGCAGFGLKNTVGLTLRNNVAVGAALNVMTQTPASPNGTATPRS